MLSFHSYWTKPSTTKEITLWDFEWLTWLTSLLQAKTYGSMVLITDPRGADFIENIGLTPFYDEIITGLEEIPGYVDPQIFWAAGKLYAIRLLNKCKKPIRNSLNYINSLDCDCIPWTLPTNLPKISCINMEKLSWAWYRSCKEKYQDYLPSSINWQLAPGNNGIIGFRDYSDMLQYAKFSIGFIEKFSKMANKSNYFDKPHYIYGDGMTFAEQQLLPASMQLIGETVNPLLPVRDDGYLDHNAFFTHLWTTKTLYRAFPEARIHYTNQLIRYLRKEFPKCIPTLAKRELEVTQPVLTTEENYKLNKEGYSHFKSYNTAIVHSIKGKAALRDRNIFGTRELTKGSIILPGDKILIAKDNTKIDLESLQPLEYFM